MKRILVIGPGGAGKSTFAKRLGEILELKVIHLDSLFWNGFLAKASEQLARGRHSNEKISKGEI